jgi:hypothetical protein
MTIIARATGFFPAAVFFPTGAGAFLPVPGAMIFAPQDGQNIASSACGFPHSRQNMNQYFAYFYIRPPLTSHRDLPKTGGPVDPVR